MNEIDRKIFNIDIPSSSPAPGALLIAEPFLRDRNFAHAVICLVDYEPHGTAMGIVMNRATSYTLAELVKDITRTDEIAVYCGGPMSCDRLYYIHTLGDILPGSKEIAPGLFIGGDFEAMTEYINAGYPTDGHIRFFIGYSGWSRNQLDEEIASGVWAVGRTAAAPGVLSGEEDAYWHREVRRLGPDFSGWLYHPLNLHAN
jgi:putative transcriptional regulator